jgi:hypothetical protein
MPEKKGLRSICRGKEKPQGRIKKSKVKSQKK